MTAAERKELLKSLKTRFDRNVRRHAGIAWEEVESRLAASPAAMASVAAMEATGGEPDVIGRDPANGRFLVCDCAPESPAGRRSACYDRAARDARKENRPQEGAADWAADMGIALLTEKQYRALQELGEFDLKTSSWISTPADIRALGGALFCDRRYGKVFVYHNGVQSYYAARGFRGIFLL